MSASREKKARQELNESGYVDPRKAREAEEKAKERRSTRIYTAVIVAFVLLGVVLFASGRIQASNEAKETARIGAESAVTIDGEDFSVNDVAYYYGSIYNTFANNGSSFGFDSSKSAREQQYTEGKTWHDYFLESALDYMKESVAVAHAAEAAGFDGAEQMDSAEQSNLSMVDLYASYSGATRAQYLTAMFGKYMTEEAFVRCVRRNALASAYQQSYSDSLTYTDAELEAAYQADPKTYDKAAWEYVVVSGAADSTTDADGNTVQATDEEQAAAKETAKATAEEILAAYNSGKSLESIAGNYEKATYYNTTDATYYDGVVGNWLFDDARKDGDTEILEVGTNYYVGLFHSRGREEYKTVDIRHILITPETGTKAQGDEGYEDEQTQLKAAARTKAEEILAQWKSGEATEDSFAQLALENSADGSKYDGGLYTRVTKGWAVEEFNDWCFDASRKDGDTGIVDTTYGSHVMYFVGYDLPAWAASVTSDLQEKAASEWSTALSENADVQQSDFGMKFVG